MKKIDLHIHSNKSDGVLNPFEIGLSNVGVCLNDNDIEQILQNLFNKK